MLQIHLYIYIYIADLAHDKIVLNVRHLILSNINTVADTVTKQSSKINKNGMKGVKQQAAKTILLHPYNDLYPTWVSRYQKGKTSLDVR